MNEGIELIIVIAGCAAALLNAKVMLGWMRIARQGTPRRVDLFFSAEDGGWVAVCDLPGISAFGETPEIALFELRRVYRLAIEAYQEQGWPV